MEAKLREQIANQFAEKHLKALLNDKVFNQLRRKMSDWADEAIAKRVGTVKTNLWTRPTITIAAQLQAAIRQRVEEVSNELIEDKIQDMIRDAVRRYELQLTDRLRSVLNDALSEQKIDELVEKGIQGRLQLAAELSKDGRPKRSIQVD